MYGRHLSCSAGLALACLATGLAAQSPLHAIAIVNDARSHGVVGDNWLSMNEAIQLNNQTLTIAQLSAAEQTQVLGFGDIAFVEIDTSAVPILTFERDLDVILDTYHGLLIGATYGVPEVRIGNTRGFVSTSNFSDFRRMRIKGGKNAITVLQTNTNYGSLLENLVFEGQTESAIKFVFPTDAGNSRLQIQLCEFIDIPYAVLVEDSGRNRTGDFFFSDNTVRGGLVGLGMTLGSGGTGRVLVERSRFLGTQVAVTFQRPNPGDDRALLLEGRLLSVSGGQVGFEFAGHANRSSEVILQMLDLSAARTSLQLGPLGATHKVTVQDSRLSGTVRVEGGSTGYLVLDNTRLASGTTLGLGATGAPVTITDSILRGCTVTTAGTSPVTIGASRLEGGSVAGTAGAPVSVTGCFVNGTTLGAHTTTGGLLPAAQLGSMEVTPLDPQAGTSVQLQPDLPPGLAGVWFLGQTAYLPTMGPPPIRLYFDLFAFVGLPGVARLQTPTVLRIPNTPAVVGSDLIVQLVVVPDPGMQAPWLSIPPGRRFVVR